jgi:hypothetical protein
LALRQIFQCLGEPGKLPVVHFLAGSLAGLSQQHGPIGGLVKAQAFGKDVHLANQGGA